MLAESSGVEDSILRMQNRKKRKIEIFLNYNKFPKGLFRISPEILLNATMDP